ncbi:thiamine ABC transporter substrate-binding protein, partial [bacterium]|nr:thiamine ABC transporter substrate-binding protein [bacterium]
MKKGLAVIIVGILVFLGVKYLGPELTENKEITLMTHDSFNVSKEVVAQFEKKYGVKLIFVKAGDAGAAVNKAILSKNNPMADVFFGVDNTFMSRALNAGIFEPYKSPLLARIPDDLKLDSENRLLPVDFGDVCLNYDKQWFAKKSVDPPTGLEDLIKPAYRGLTVVENPATSSPGLAFLFTTIGRFGENDYLDYWKNLRKNDVLVTNGWEEAYWGNFTAASKGNRPIVVSYASSPPAEVHYSKTPLKDTPIAAVIENKTCYRQIEFVGILKGTKKRKLAENLVDFLLDTAFQEDIPLQMFVFPANKTAKHPDVFIKYAKVAIMPIL